MSESAPQPNPQDENLERLFQAALGPPARPMSTEQIAQVQEAARRAVGFPVWALAALTVGLALLLAAGLSGIPSDNSGLLRTAAVLVPLANLITAPFAALAIIRQKRKKSHER